MNSKTDPTTWGSDVLPAFTRDVSGGSMGSSFQKLVGDHLFRRDHEAGRHSRTPSDNTEYLSNLPLPTVPE